MSQDKKQLSISELLKGTSDDDAIEADKPSMADVLKPEPKHPDPLAELEYTGDVGTDALAEADVLMHAFESAEAKAKRKGFQARAKAETKRASEATDSDFYLVPCFQTAAQKFAFLEALGLHPKGQPAHRRRFPGDYIDGRLIVKAINRLIDRGEHISIPAADVKYTDPWSKVDKKLERLAQEFEE